MKAKGKRKKAEGKGPKADPRLAELGRRLRAAREAKGLTQEALAAAARCAGNSVWRWESGRAQISALDLARLARALGTPIGELLE